MPLKFLSPFFSVFSVMPFHLQFCQRLLAFFFPGSKQHFTGCSALAFLACFWSTFFAVHLAAASSRSLTFSGVLMSTFAFSFPSQNVLLALLPVPSHKRSSGPMLSTSSHHCGCILHHFFSSSDDVIQLRCLLFLFWAQMSERDVISLALPHTDHVEEALQLNSFIIPNHINFLKPSGSLSYPCQHKGPYIPVNSSMSFSSVHIIPNATLTSPAMRKSLAPARRPSRSTTMTLEMQASYISKLLLESGAYTAITRVVLKRIAAHLCSNFHDLFCAKLFRNQQRCEPRFATATQISKQFQIGHIQEFGRLNGEDGRSVRVRVSRSQEFFLSGEDV